MFNRNIKEKGREEKFHSGFNARKIFAILMIAATLFSVVFISGCVSQPTSTIKSERDVGEAVTNISGDVEDVSQILTEIDKKLT